MIIMKFQVGLQEKKTLYNSNYNNNNNSNKNGLKQKLKSESFKF